jgi:hypothetical protein
MRKVLRDWFKFQVEHPYLGKLGAIFIDFLYNRNDKKFHEEFVLYLNLFHKELYSGAIERIDAYKLVKRSIGMIGHETARYNKTKLYLDQE